MKDWKVNLLILSSIVGLAVLAGFFVYPQGMGERYLPWRLGLDLVGGSALTYEVDLSTTPDADRDEVVSGLREVIERRVNQYGVAEPKVATLQKGDNYQLLVELPGISNLEEAIRQIGETPQLDFRELRYEGNDETSTATPVATALTGRHIVNADWEYDQTGVNIIVTFELNDEGAKLFEEITARNIGQPLCIFVDGAPLGGCPIVREKIAGGRAEISGGNITKDSARELVSRFKAGALSAPIKLVNQRTISPSAASDALGKMIFAGGVGLALVMLFMIVYYRVLGVFAALALAIYTVLTLALFKATPNFTMTLAGIAGFVLSIGMAVDANILIFARIREEIKKGLSRASAVEEGFKKAWFPIRDSNTSTIITAIILYYLTTGFVKGFALTLIVGVLASMFSAIFVTRTMLKIFMRK